jgi:hypothetical protein
MKKGSGTATWVGTAVALGGGVLLLALIAVGMPSVFHLSNLDSLTSIASILGITAVLVSVRSWVNGWLLGRDDLQTRSRLFQELRQRAETQHDTVLQGIVERLDDQRRASRGRAIWLDVSTGALLYLLGLGSLLAVIKLHLLGF